MNIQGPFDSNVKVHNQLYAGTSCKIRNNQMKRSPNGKIITLASPQQCGDRRTISREVIRYVVGLTPQRLHAEIPLNLREEDYTV